MGCDKNTRNLCNVPRHEERHRRHAYGTNSRKMRNNNAEDHKFASLLMNAYIYDAMIASFSGITSILRLPKS
jgi:hypothetical protein